MKNDEDPRVSAGRCICCLFIALLRAIRFDVGDYKSLSANVSENCWPVLAIHDETMDRAHLDAGIAYHATEDRPGLRLFLNMYRICRAFPHA